MTARKRWSFIVDTTDYSGNFERELCAFVTGRCTGEIHEGIAQLFHRECPDVEEYVNDLIGCRFRHPGVYSPHDPVLSPGETGPCRSVAIFLDREPTEKDVEFLFNRAKRFPGVHERGPKKILSCRVEVETIVTLTVRTLTV